MTEWPSWLPARVRAELENDEERYIANLDRALTAHLRKLTGDAKPEEDDDEK